MFRRVCPGSAQWRAGLSADRVILIGDGIFTKVGGYVLGDLLSIVGLLAASPAAHDLLRHEVRFRRLDGP